MVRRVARRRRPAASEGLGVLRRAVRVYVLPADEPVLVVADGREAGEGVGAGDAGERDAQVARSGHPRVGIGWLSAGTPAGLVLAGRIRETVRKRAGQQLGGA